MTTLVVEKVITLPLNGSNNCPAITLQSLVPALKVIFVKSRFKVSFLASQPFRSGSDQWGNWDRV